MPGADLSFPDAPKGVAISARTSPVVLRAKEPEESHHGAVSWCLPMKPQCRHTRSS